MTTPTDDTELAHAPGRARQYLSSTAKHGGIYAFGMILSRLAGFIMLPVYTRVLSAADYGVLEILALSADVLAMLAGLGIGMALIRHYYLYDDEESRHGVVSTASLLSLGVFSTVAIVGLVFAEPITEVLLGAGQSVHLVRLAIISLVISVLVDIPLVFLRAQQRSMDFSVASTVRLVLALTLNILFVVKFRMGVEGVLYSNIISALVVGGYLSFSMFRLTGLRFVPKVARELVGFGSPLMLAQVGSFVLHFSDRYFLRVYTTLAVVGLYSLSYKFAMLIAVLVSGPFSAIWIPKALEIERREGLAAGPILSEIIGHFSVVLVSMALGVALFSGEVIAFVTGPAFHEADRPIPMLALAMVVFGFRQVSQVGALIGKKPQSIALATTTAAAGVLLLNLLLIPRWGAMGAAAATLGAFAVEFALMWVLSRRAHPLRLRLSPLLGPVGVAIAIWAVAALLAVSVGHLSGLAIRIAAFGTYVGALVAFGFVRREHLALLLRAVRDPRAAMRALKEA